MRRGVRLGVDVGSVRVGLAACDPEGLIATAVETLAREQDPASQEAASDIARIASEVLQRAAIEVVVGLPLSMNGKANAAATAVRGYAKALADVIAPVPVRLVDERLTTVSAHQALRSAGRPGKWQRSVVDQVAAVMILQHALDAERGVGRPPGTVVR